MTSHRELALIKWYGFYSSNLLCILAYAAVVLLSPTMPTVLQYVNLLYYRTLAFFN